MKSLRSIKVVKVFAFSISAGLLLIFNVHVKLPITQGFTLLIVIVAKIITKITAVVAAYG